ncbi:putative PSF1-part of GINS, replication multi protein complex [Cantharellus anzutake]|uniref:putative PSF1-part of GINS, replication multi protein complex n=1 Tax=Cantharellus anzutake TaxID=1750568 RepID=UPI0019047A79|nr:putative PSF1-part of GINS, replication multi protein complex [Cantharellus anzutake]KAF8323517.1 putative PSF1-part of GINS, replication multi protein complex [Cantharellus anzutake]
MFGDAAMSLIIEARRSQALDTLLNYNDETVRNVVREIRSLDADMQAAITESMEKDPDAEPSKGVMCEMHIYNSSVQHNKRCLLSYLASRIDRLKDSFWASNGALPHLLNDPEIRHKISPHEVDFLRQYNALIMDYRSDVLDVLDVAASLTNPPKDLYVEVRVLRECGTIQTEVGSIDFKRGQRFMVRRSDVEHLIVQGYLEMA